MNYKMNKNLFKEGLKKYWVIPCILTVILALMVPIYTLLQKEVIDANSLYFQQIDESTQNSEDLSKTNIGDAYKKLVTDTFIYSPYGMMIILVLPIVLGVQLFGPQVKNKNRLADYIKEKKLNREEVYKTNILTGTLLTIIPIIVSSILLIIIKLFGGMTDYITAKTILSWSVLGLSSSVLFFVFTALIGFITKNKVTQVLYTYGLLFIPAFMIYLFEIFMTKVIYGFPGFAQWFVECINQIPAIKVCQMFTTKFANYTFETSINLWYALVYVIIIAAIIFVGYKLLNIKKQENLNKIGDIIFKYMWISIIGAFLYIAFMLMINNPMIAIIITVAVCLIVYIIKQLITKKSFKALSNGKKYYIISVVVILFVLIFSSDLFGYEKKMPDIEEIEYMTYTASYPKENEEIEFRTVDNIDHLVEKHKNFILTKDKIKDIYNEEYTTVYLKYKLKNGDVLVRSYQDILSSDDPMFVTEEYVKQKYSYIYDKKDDIDIIKIGGTYNDKLFIIEANKYDNPELLSELVSYTANDLLNHNVHLPIGGEYNQYSDKEGIQIIQIGVLDGMNQYSSYLYYLKVDNSYELVNKLQTLINEESELISWEENTIQE